MISRPIALVIPRLDLPFKESVNFEKDKRKLPDHITEVRKPWHDFFEVLKQTLDEMELPYKEYLIPMWEMTPEFLAGLSEDVLIISHRNSKQISIPGKTILYTMQIMTKFLFSIDHKGWGASSSFYPSYEYTKANADPSAFEAYKKHLIEKAESKFDQPKPQSRMKLIFKKELPLGSYLFFPCQIPHDQSIEFHSDVEEIDVIKALVEWADKNKVHIVFKKHPVNLRSMEPFEPLIEGSRYSRWSDANIHDLIRHAKGVYTINSGVGFEALLHHKPVVTFGRTEYDVIGFKSGLQDLDKAYQFINDFDFERDKIEYHRFFQWYCYETCVDVLRSIEDQKTVLKNYFNKLLGDDLF